MTRSVNVVEGVLVTAQLRAKKTVDSGTSMDIGDGLKTTQTALTCHPITRDLSSKARTKLQTEKYYKIKKTAAEKHCNCGRN